MYILGLKHRYKMKSHAIHCIKITTILLISLQIGICLPTKSISRPVHEIVNEQSRIDKSSNLDILPYGNPLAGNSKQNARLHAQSQQAMFIAEKLRKHRAQIQRWTQTPLKIDSYMKAYHESQENHQLAFENLYNGMRGIGPVTHAPKKIQNNKERSIKTPTIHEVIGEGNVKTSGNRNHRSQGSILNYISKPHLETKTYQTLNILPGATYDEGVTIKPNGNVGLAGYGDRDNNKLYTSIVPSNTKSAEEIDSLVALLDKNPSEQVEGLANIIQTQQNSGLQLPADYFFYLKDPTQTQITETHTDNLDNNSVKDHTPITEAIDDVEDPNNIPFKPYVPPEAGYASLKNNNFYKGEIVSEHISLSPISHSYSSKEQKPVPEALHYARPHTYFPYKSPENKYENIKYYHHNIQNSGIHHLTDVGTALSAYGNENVSNSHNDNPIDNILTNNMRSKRSTLETNLFVSDITPLTTKLPSNITTEINNNNETLPTPEPLRNIAFNKKNVDFFITTPNFAIGEAVENSYNDYEEINNKFVSYYDDDYESDDSNEDDSYNGELLNTGTVVNNYHNVDSIGSFTHKHGLDRSPSIISLNYGVPHFGHSYSNYDAPLRPPSTNFRVPYLTASNIENIPKREPIFILTESQLKRLVGNQNLNIQHLDYIQVSKQRNKHYSTKHKKRYPSKFRNRKLRKNILKLHKLTEL